MNIVMYFINWNDLFYLPFIADHYSFCSKIVMYDNHSSDRSVHAARQLGFEVRYFGKSGELNDQRYLDVKNHCWKECRGKNIDYVIVCDADEFVIPENLSGAAPVVQGYNMISNELPINKITEIKTGSPDINYSKQAIFAPDRIQEINYIHGCHRNEIKRAGKDLEKDGTARLLHYRMIGGVERMITRHSDYRRRMSHFNRKHGMGVHYLDPDEVKRNDWKELESKAIELW